MKYTLANRWSCSKTFLGRKDRKEYFVVRILLLLYSCRSSFSSSFSVKEGTTVLFIRWCSLVAWGQDGCSVLFMSPLLQPIMFVNLSLIVSLNFPWLHTALIWKIFSFSFYSVLFSYSSCCRTVFLFLSYLSRLWKARWEWSKDSWQSYRIHCHSSKGKQCCKETQSSSFTTARKHRSDTPDSRVTKQRLFPDSPLKIRWVLVHWAGVLHCFSMFDCKMWDLQCSHWQHPCPHWQRLQKPSIF